MSRAAHTVALRDIALARSGDKGGHANIGVWVRDRDVYDKLRAVLTADAVKAHFADDRPRDVVRYELPNLLAFNFVLVDVLGVEGASASLRNDAQAKVYGSRLLSLRVTIEP